MADMSAMQHKDFHASSIGVQGGPPGLARPYRHRSTLMTSQTFGKMGLVFYMAVYAQDNTLAIVQPPQTTSVGPDLFFFTTKKSDMWRLGQNP